MKQRIGRVIRGLSLAYSAAILLWFLLRAACGDTLWWLVILNAFAPLFFLPLVALLPSAACLRRRAGLGLLPALLIFGWLHAHLFLPAWPAPAISAEPPFTVLTFNIWGGSQEAATAQAVQQYSAADIIVLQELPPAMEPLLIEALGATHPHRWLQAAPGPAGMGIFSRYPLQIISAAHLQTGQSHAQIIQVALGARRLTVYNCHPVATNPLLAVENGTPIADEVRQRGAERDQFMAALLADAAQREGPIMLAGDFNVTPYNDLYRTLSADFSDSHASAGWGFQHTFPAYAGSFRGLPTPPRLLRLDMLLTSPELVALASSAGSAHGESDHLPVLGKFAWRAAAP